MITRSLAVGLFLFLSGLTFVSAQENIHSSGYWIGISADKKVIKKVKWKGGLELRTNYYLGEVQNAFIQNGLTYKVSKKVDAQFIYRLAFKSPFFIHRFDGRLSYEKKVAKRTYLEGTLKFQHQSTDLSGVWEQRLRSKIGIERKIKKRDLYPNASLELFLNRNFEYTNFDAYRFTIGMKYNLTKDHSISFDYFRDAEFHVTNPSTEHILALNLSVDL